MRAKNQIVIPGGGSPERHDHKCSMKGDDSMEVTAGRGLDLDGNGAPPKHVYGVANRRTLVTSYVS
jgi:hypothetical protein